VTQAYTNVFPDTTRVSILAVTTLRSSLSMYVFFVCNHFFSLLLFVSSSPEFTFRISLVSVNYIKYVNIAINFISLMIFGKEFKL
jgi:hypothetical protein